MKVEEAGLEMPAVVMRRWSMPRRLRFKRDSTPTPLSLSRSLCVSRSLGLSALSLSALSLAVASNSKRRRAGVSKPFGAVGLQPIRSHAQGATQGATPGHVVVDRNSGTAEER